MTPQNGKELWGQRIDMISNFMIVKFQLCASLPCSLSCFLLSPLLRGTLKKRPLLKHTGTLSPCEQERFQGGWATGALASVA